MIALIIFLVIAGVVLQFVKPYVEPRLFTAAIIIIVVAICLIILNMFGLFHGGPSLR